MQKTKSFRIIGKAWEDLNSDLEPKYRQREKVTVFGICDVTK